MSTVSDGGWDGGRKRDMEDDSETDSPRKKVVREGADV